MRWKAPSRGYVSDKAKRRATSWEGVYCRSMLLVTVAIVASLMQAQAFPDTARILGAAIPHTTGARLRV